MAELHMVNRDRDGHCLFGDDCLCPHIDHTDDECFTVEMAEEWAMEAKK